MKTCSKCGMDKPLDRFTLQSKESGRRRAHCKECERAYHRAYYERKRGARAKTVYRARMGGPSADATALLRYIEGAVLTTMSMDELSIMLAKRTGVSPDTWQRRWQRLKRNKAASVYILDELCLALGLHLADVDPYYIEVGA